MGKSTDVNSALVIAKNARKTLRAAITKDVKYVNDTYSEVTSDNRDNVELQIGKLKRYRDELAEVDKVILEKTQFTDEDMQKDLEKQAEYKNSVHDTIDRLELRLRRMQQPTQVNQTASGQPNQHTMKVKHEKLELTSYDGDPLRWEEFWDDFTCSVDSRQDITVIDKFKLLKQSLKGDALSVADGYFLTQRNYQEVKDSLQERFGDPQVAIFAHFEALLELAPASHEVDSLTRIRDKCEAHIRSLAALGLTEDTYGLVFAPIILSKLPRFVKLEMHRRNGSKRWTLKALREILKDEIQARTKSDKGFAGPPDQRNGGKKEGGGRKKGTGDSLLSHGGKGKSKGSTVKSEGTKKSVCVFCKGGHQNYECTKYPTVDTRLPLAKGRCFACLSDNHMKKDCKSTKNCYYCGDKGHHSSLCYKQFGKPSHATPNPDSSSASGHSNLTQGLNPNVPEFVPAGGSTAMIANPGSAGNRRSGMAILESALVPVKGSKGRAKARVVFDNASTWSFVRGQLSREVGAKVVGHGNSKIGRFGDESRKNCDHKFVQLEFVLKDGSTMRLMLRQEENISAPLQLSPIPLDQVCQRFRADEFTGLVSQPSSADIDILIGLDYYYDIVGPEVWRAPSGIVVKDTAVGKILTGFVKGSSVMADSNQQMLISGVSQREQELLDLERFWKIEETGVVRRTDRSDDELAVELFNKSVRFVDGRYEVKWPFKEDPPNLPENYQVALRRLVSVHRKLVQTPDLLSTYDEIFSDQRDKGVIEEAPNDPEGPLHYLPHHAVVIPSRETTKVRLVFDASSKPNVQFCSLNESMYRGPVFLNDLCGLLLRFRVPEFGVTSDVQKAFLQISLNKEHRDCTRFLWLRDPKKPPTPDNIVVYRYARVLFGATASPFLLAATIIHHLKMANTEVSTKIIGNTYMDNIIGGFRTTEEMISYFHAAKGLFNDMNMNLHQWYSNDEQFMAAIPTEERGTRASASVLGLKWDHFKDTLTCTVGSTDLSSATKRAVLKCIASVYDPCGWFSPVTVLGKMLMQELWKAKVGWDDPLSPEFQKKWEAIQQSLQALPTYNIRRVYSNSKTGSTDETEFHLHIFCDASAKAYSACAYMVAIQGDFVSVDLVFAKSRVAPVKELTIPKLELTAVVMGTRIVQFVEQHMNIKFASKFIWTDSMCTLSWILGDKVTTSFVQSRVREIRSVSGLEFRFVPSEMNPADLGSRGVPFSTLKEKDLWWKGPPWLHQELKWPPQDKIPISMPKPASEDVAVVSIAHSPDPDSLLNLKRFSSLKKLLRVSVWVFRACVRFKKKKAPCGSMSAKELDNALDFWEKRIQAHHFNPLLHDSKEPQWKAFSKQLGLLIDTKGIIRCRGRFNFSESLEEGAKFPILLPKSSEFTRLVIEDCHRKSLHFGVKHTLAKLRERYWICQGRSQVKSVLLQCQVCRRYGGGPFQVPDPAPLPSFRASIKRPFACVGLDYLGPLFVRAQPDSKKVWICLITCAVSRAVHLEVVSSLSAADFLLCLRRFASIYGKPDIIVSDNARQFKAADRMLQKEFERLAAEPEVQDYISGSGTSWKFIVEKAPWMGGFYERLVAVVKEALKKSLARWTVTQEELQTLCYEVASVVNNRPLIYSEDDPSDKVLTPSDLLFKSVKCFPDGSGEQVFQADMSKADELLLHWKAGQNLLRQFWDAWRDHYLVALRDFDRIPKGRGASPIAVDLGLVVLIKDNLPRGQWKVGRISKLRASHDGEIRAAEVTLPSGSVLVRPIKLLYPIEGGQSTSQVTQTNANDMQTHLPSTNNNLDTTENATRQGSSTTQTIPTARPTRQAAQASRQLTKRMLSSA